MDKYIELTLTDRVHLSMREQYAMRFISNGIAVPQSYFNIFKEQLRTIF